MTCTTDQPAKPAKRANGQTGKRAHGQTGKRANRQTGKPNTDYPVSNTEYQIPNTGVVKLRPKNRLRKAILFVNNI
ncbi:hypothetical protein D3OALGA1CA_3272 [Olavius algarvensis associated proteobacterium Delta 3]|nr:hypothetical protein D3OALGA1CA_3272 [Olavius algarvensis associated proteobacterium Delta 3]